MPSRLSEGLDKAPVDTFFYRFYGMYPAVLAARMAACGEGERGRYSGRTCVAPCRAHNGRPRSACGWALRPGGRDGKPRATPPCWYITPPRSHHTCTSLLPKHFEE